ncbi:MAG: hypothetical protein MZV63_66935 [Marinilabiliales bacterium]|nr:hypothetical protein [Marinilabiliales bacterium]
MLLFDGTWTSADRQTSAGFADGIDNTDDAEQQHHQRIQASSLSGTVLSLRSGGGSVTLPSSGGGDNWDSDCGDQHNPHRCRNDCKPAGSFKYGNYANLGKCSSKPADLLMDRQY